MMRHKVVTAIMLVMILLVAGCTNNQEVMPQSDTAPNLGFVEKTACGVPRGEGEFDADFGSSAYTTGTSVGASEWGSMVIRSASVRIEAEDVSMAIDTLLNLTTDTGGYVQTSSQWKSNNQLSAHYVVRIPAQRFDSFLRNLAELGDVVRSDVSSQDVTEEYIDNEAKLGTLQIEEATYVKFLDKAKNLDEILKIERELNRIRYEIERAKGRQQFLQNRIQMSSITIDISTKPQPTSTSVSSFPQRIKYAFRDGCGVFVGFITGITTFIVWLLPFLPVLIVVFWVLRRLWRKRSKRTDSINNR